ncbi:MAG: FAD binding domain-containing protein [Candidatus Binatia bacterium]
MKPAPFEYLAPESFSEALVALAKHAPEAKILAGGQSLMPLLNFRLLKPSILIDLNRIRELGYIKEVPEGLLIGTMTRQSSVERSQLVKERCPLLTEAMKHIGHVAIRHRGTIGGSLVHGDPAAELPSVALALEAKFTVVGRSGDRTIPADEFFIDYLTTAVGPEEILKETIFPSPPPSTGYAVEEFVRRHGDFALAGVTAVVELDQEGKIADSRLALFGVAPTAVRARKTEAALRGERPSLDLFRAAASLLDDVIDPPSDIHASSEYRRKVAAVLTVRALERAVSRCQMRPA